MAFLDKFLSNKLEVDLETEETKKNEYIWIEGYKGTDRDMCCRGYQYELNKIFQLADDAEPEMCINGFHLCKYLHDVYRYYRIGGGNRFFKVRALVKKGDFDNYGCDANADVKFSLTPRFPEFKLVAKAIEFVRELTVDEILDVYGYNNCENWTEEYKKLVLEIGIDGVKDLIRKDKLESLGYASEFANLIVEDDNRYRVAVAVASQPDLSMDMKAYLIFKF